MNFLGHLYLSNNDHPLMMANLFGDFVKGKDYTYLPEIVQQGVLLHREIDDYIDHHETVKELRLKLYLELPKVAGIAIDLYMDHCLAKCWNDFHKEALSDYLTRFFNYALTPSQQKFEHSEFQYPHKFIELLTLIHNQKWITNYQYPKGLDFACNGLSKRISFPNNLDEGLSVYKKHENLINKTFSIFMKDVIRQF